MKLLGKVTLYAELIIALAIAIFILHSCTNSEPARAEISPATGWASWYSYESSIKEGCSGIMANGEVYDEKELVCASWDYPFETRLKITNLANAKTIIAVVKDRGPAKRLVKKGRIIDLSQAAFARIADLKQGIIKVKIEIL